ncbi:hypothetical protein [Terrimonas alba]|uniref:hypothetical protein n=1 Tax=Terrimonas alba TaxID=3349636 RepID=UPI0035F29DC7
MQLLKKLFLSFIYSNLFIACCAVLMVFQTCELLLNESPAIYFVLFVFFATITSYSFHWYLTPVLNTSPVAREKWLLANRNVHAALFIIGIAGSVITGIFLLDHWQWLLLSAFITFLYSAPKIPHPYFRILRKAALGKTIFLALVWMYVTTMLPLIISDHPWKTSFTLFSISRFFLIYAICILFDYRDRDYDRKVGIRSLITWLNDKGITLLFYGSLIVFAWSTVWMIHYGFSLLVVVLILVPGAITGLLFRHAKRNFSDLLYYFILDGLMALSALLTGLLLLKHSKY